MNVNPVKLCTAPSFGRALNSKREQKECREAVLGGLETLDKNLCVIVPASCCPSKEGEDVGVGSPYQPGTISTLYPFLSSFGFTKQQEEPAGVRKNTNPSPYESNISGHNTLLLGLKNYTKPENGGLISNKTYKKIIDSNPKKGQSDSALEYAFENNRAVLKEAYSTFEEKRANMKSLSPVEHDAIEQLDKDWKVYLKKHTEEQEKNALYDVLQNLYSMDYWPNWGNDPYDIHGRRIDCPTDDWNPELDKNLFKSPMTEEKQKRIKHLKTEYKNTYETYLFSQMLTEKAIKEGKNTIENKYGIVTLGDVPVKMSDAEWWGNQDIFLDNMKMGCSEPWSDSPQYWHAPVVNPDTLFNKDGSLGKGGQFMYNRYKNAFDGNKGGVRLDHVLGIIDPYVYNPDNHSQCGRLYSELYRGVNGDKFDRILKEIVIPAAAEAGLEPSDIVAEDVGYMPQAGFDTLRRLGFGTTTITQWMDDRPNDVRNTGKNNAVMIGNHDTQTAVEKYPDPNRRNYKWKELFLSGARNIQIMWTDLLGLRDRYNTPGTTGFDCWSKRMTPDFADVYHKNVENNVAPNIPKLILQANREKNPNYDREHRENAQKLNEYANILDER